LFQNCTVGVSALNGDKRVERDSPPPGTFPRKLSGPRQQQGKQSQSSHGVFIPARDEATKASDVMVSFTRYTLVTISLSNTQIPL